MKKYQEQWRRIVAEALGSFASESGAAGLDTASLVVETPPKTEMGDIAFPMFPFAKPLRKAPPLIAAEVARRVPGVAGAAQAGTAIAAGPYVNVRLAPAPVIDDVLSEIAAGGSSYGRGTDLNGSRVMLEFSCPNTNKPLHLGHLRNDAIGESLSKILSAAGAN